MSMKLQDLEAVLPADIVRKGLDYFAADLVDNLAEQDYKWQADVHGTHTYTVSIELAEDRVINWFCDCPYDWGPICKHVAAVLFAIRTKRGEADLAKMPYAGKVIQHKGKKTKKQKTDPVEQILGLLKKKELQELLQYLAKREDEVRAYVLTKYSDRLPLSSKKEFEQLVKSVIKSHISDRHGFIDYRSSARLGDQLYRLIAEASGTWPLIYLCEEVIDQGASACMEADDSSGSIGGAIDFAFNQLYDLAVADSGASQQVLDYLFSMALKKHSHNKYDGFDWGGNFRHLATLAVQSKKEAEILIQSLDQYVASKQDEKYGRYEIEQAELQKLKLLETWRTSAEAESYLLGHVHLTGFRRKALEKAWVEERYKAVQQLAEDGIVADERFAGLVAEWKNWLIRVAEATGDQKKLIELMEAKYLATGEINYYRQLKKLLPKAVFAQKVAVYIERFEKRLRPYGGGFSSHVAAIYQEEGQLDELMGLIATHPSLNLLDHYRTLLAKDHQALYLQLYDRGVRQKMDHSSNRLAYQECCHYLNWMMKLGGRELVRQIIADWQETYPRRWAMLEELSFIKI